MSETKPDMSRRSFLRLGAIVAAGAALAACDSQIKKIPIPPTTPVPPTPAESAVPITTPAENPPPTSTTAAKVPTAEPTNPPATPEPTQPPAASPEAKPTQTQPAAKETPIPNVELKLTAEDINFLAAHEISYGDKTKSNVAVTFDAGSDGSLWPKMKDALIKANVKITVFLTGDFIAKYPNFVREMITMGLEIGNHSTKHPDFVKITKPEMQEEVFGFQKKLDEIAGKHIPVRFFRFPFGSRDKVTMQVLAEMGLQSVFWSSDGDSGGWKEGADPKEVLAKALAALNKGNVNIMHIGSQQDVDALPIVLQEVQKKGLKVAPMSEVSAEKDDPPSIAQAKKKGLPPPYSFSLPGYSYSKDSVSPGPTKSVEKERKKYPIEPKELYKGEPGHNEIALTFDIGEHNESSINSILAVLKKKNIKVSVFVVGTYAKAHPEIIKVLLADGHEVLNHSYAHLDYAKTPSATMIQDAQQFESVMTEITGGKYAKRPYFRFPSVSSNETAIKTMSATGRLLINGSVILHDWDKTEDPATQAPAHLTRLQKAADGDVVIGHLNSPELPKVLEQAIDQWNAKGLKVVTISTMFPVS